MQTKNKHLLLLLSLLTPLLPFSLLAAEQNSSKTTVKIGYIPNFGTLLDPLIKGAEGFGYEYFEEISKYTNHTYEYVLCDWEEGFELLEKGEIDLFGPVGISPERLEKFEYPIYPFGYDQTLLVADENTTFAFDDLDALHGTQITVTSNSTHITALETFLENNDLDAEIVPVTTPIGSLIIPSSIDGLSLTDTLHPIQNKNIIAKLDTSPFYYIAQKGNSQLIDTINNAFINIRAQDNLFYSKLLLKYYGNIHTAKPTLTKKHFQLLAEKPTFNVGFYPDLPPLSYLSTEGVPTGVIIDIMDLIAEDANITFNYIAYDASHQHSSKDIDLNVCIIGDHLLDTHYVSTNPYLEVPFMLVELDLSTQNRSPIIGSFDYNTFDIKIFKNILPDFTVQTYSTLDEMYNLLISGEISGIISSSLTSNVLLNLLSNSKYAIHTLDLSVPFSIGISPNLSQEYLDIFNILIKRIDPHTLSSILINNTSKFVPAPTLLDLLKQNIIVVIISIVLLLGSFFSSILFINYKKKQQLLKLINTDQLTGTLSEYKFLIEATNLIQTALPNTYQLISIDIDNFKYINESHTYGSGSLVLQHLATYLSSQLSEDELISRLNSDKFILLVKSSHVFHSWLTSLPYLDFVANNLSPILGSTYPLSISQGIYTIKNPSLDLVHMIDCANIARRLGKNLHGNTSFDFSDPLEDLQITKNKIIATMEHSLINKEFHVYYQPKIQLNSSEVIGAEALIRWIPEPNKIIPPDDFIPLFEKNGFIVKLDHYVFNEVCTFVKTNKDLIGTNKISINLSGATLLQDNLPQVLLKILTFYNIDIGYIELEITESAIVSNPQKLINMIAQLKDLGFTISMDDFGTGTSSLNRLKDIQLDILKIDKEFLTNTLTQEKGHIIIENIIQLAKQLGLLTVAEGVETYDHVTLLKSLQCDIAQGYYFSRPLPAQEFITYMQSQKDAQF